MIAKKVEFAIVVYRFLMLFGLDDINATLHKSLAKWIQPRTV